MVELDQFKYRISGYDAQIENIKQSLDLDSKKKRIEELEAVSEQGIRRLGFRRFGGK